MHLTIRTGSFHCQLDEAIKGGIMRDQTRNIETFKLGAARLNEFEFHKHQGEMSEHITSTEEQSRDGVKTRKERVAQLTKQAHEKVLRRKKRR